MCLAGNDDDNEGPREQRDSDENERRFPSLEQQVNRLDGEQSGLDAPVVTVQDIILQRYVTKNIPWLHRNRRSATLVGTPRLKSP